MPAIASRERPILFSDPMVRAILDRRKTQTRRVVNPRTCSFSHLDDVLRYDVDAEHAIIQDDSGGVVIDCPYGRPGDRLWVREAYQVDAPRDASWPDVEFYGCEGASLDLIPDRFRSPEHVLFRSTWNGSRIRWRPSIFMPRWASRLSLEIVEVRVERVQSITDADAIAEGATWTDNGRRKWAAHIPTVKAAEAVNGQMEGWSMTGETHPDRCLGSARMAFGNLWNQINGDRHPWDSNPWVWVIGFKVQNSAPARR